MNFLSLPVETFKDIGFVLNDLQGSEGMYVLKNRLSQAELCVVVASVLVESVVLSG